MTPNLPRAAHVRRHGLRAALTAVVVLAALAVHPAPQAQSRTELRIGYQKSASLFVLQRAQGSLDKRLAALNVGIRWVEFPAGPQLLEGLNVGSIDVGFVGEAPPIFAQAAGANFVYIGADPASPEAEAIVVPKDSALKDLADLKGKKVALNKGSNVHYLLVRALERAGLKYSDIQPIFLAPADARAAFEKGSVDAWAIWDPFLASVQRQTGARTLVDGQAGLANNYQFYLAERGYAEKHPDVIKAWFEDSVAQGRWLKQHLKDAAAIIAPLQGLDAEVVALALHRYQFDVAPVGERVAAEQQQVANAFYELKLIPKPVRITDALPAATAKPAGG
jgi:sulfonate transport system substrate-binding protein